MINILKEMMNFCAEDKYNKLVLIDNNALEKEKHPMVIPTKLLSFFIHLFK